MRKSLLFLSILLVTAIVLSVGVLASEGGIQLLDLSAYFNNDGISYLDDPLDGDLDFEMRSLPAELLPESGELVSFQDVQFIFPPKENGVYNNIAAYNQQLLAPAGFYHDLYMVATATNGPQKGDFGLYYIDGTSEVIELAVSQGTGSPVFGEETFISLDYMHGILGVEEYSVNLWVVRIPVDFERQLESIRFPENPDLHVFAATLGLVPDLVKAKVVAERELLVITDPAGDDYGPGRYVYPTNSIFADGTFDIIEVKLMERDGDYLIQVTVNGAVKNDWGGPNGISAHLVQVYFDLGAGSLSEAIPGANVQFAEDRGWEKAVIHDGWGSEAKKMLLEHVPELAEHVYVTESGWVEGETINIPVPFDFLGDFNSGWGIQVLMLGGEGSNESMDGIRVRRVLPTQTEWQFGGGDNNPGRPNVIDMLTPIGQEQTEVLAEYANTGEYPVIPLVYPMQ